MTATRELPTATDTAGEWRIYAMRLVLNPTYRVLILLALVIAVGGVAAPKVLAPKNLGIVLAQSVPVAVIGLGTMIVLITGAIDLSIGAIASLSAVVLATAVAGGDPLALAVVKTLCVGVLAGAVNGLLAGVLKLPAFVVTLGSLTTAGGITIMLSGDVSLGAHQLSNIVQASVLGIRADVAFVVGLALVVHLLITRSGFGVALRGVGSDEASAALLGLSVTKVRSAAFITAGILSAVTAVLLVARTPVVTPQLGGSLLLDAFAAAVIGGTSIFGGRGSAFGTLFGAVLIAFIGNLLINIGVSSSSVDLYRGSIILLALLADALISRVERSQALR